MHIGDLQKRAQANLEKDKIQLEQTLQETLNDLTQSLEQSMKSAVSTIEADMEKIKQKSSMLTKVSLKAYLFHMICSIFLILGIFLTGESVCLYLVQDINRLRTEQKALEEATATAQATLADMQTWGITSYSSKNGKFLILPQNTKGILDWTVGEQDAIKIEKGLDF